MNARISERINTLFNSYDLFSYAGTEKNRSKARKEIPDITDEEMDELEAYMERFKEFAEKYGRLIAEKYKMPHLPYSEEAKKEVSEYVDICREEFPDIDIMHIRELFSTVCVNMNVQD